MASCTTRLVLDPHRPVGSRRSRKYRRLFGAFALVVACGESPNMAAAGATDAYATETDDVDPSSGGGSTDGSTTMASSMTGGSSATNESTSAAETTDATETTGAPTGCVPGAPFGAVRPYSAFANLRLSEPWLRKPEVGQGMTVPRSRTSPLALAKPRAPSFDAAAEDSPWQALPVAVRVCDRTGTVVERSASVATVGVAGSARQERDSDGAAVG